MSDREFQLSMVLLQEGELEMRDLDLILNIFLEE